VIEPLRLAFDVDCPPAHAFRVWTARLSAWWPADHTASGAAGVEVTLEGRVGGRIFERTPAGETHEWGEVEIRFLAQGAATRVEIEHRGWERLGAQGSDWREANNAGWGGLLPHFVAACAGNQHDTAQPKGTTA
jgi:hypothetical protein